ncbi:MAG TPA: type II CAAX endopeptidase family protein [Thermoanaerobaculia bacterium]|jgi:membrane protease YdiL (CAAX protease family)|nr:type II CAAX endopeptidase family protein [Thermoanaerobaculia bacterium]
MYCPSCRGEYREGFSSCRDCDVALVDALPEEPPEAEDLSDDPEEDLTSEEGLTVGPWEDLAAHPASDKRLRTLELLLVLFVAFGSPLVFSLIDWWRNAPFSKEYPVRAQLAWSLQAAASICVVAYVLFRQGRSLRQLGLTASRRDIPATILLTAFAFAPSIVIAGGVSSAPAFHPLASFAGGLTLGPLLWLTLLLSAACEELIVRAYLMTEIMALTGRMAFAVLASVGFQTLYHLYEGTPLAITAGVMFFINSIYYAYNRRVAPLILSHFLYNFILFGYWAHG